MKLVNLYHVALVEVKMCHICSMGQSEGSLNLNAVLVHLIVFLDRWLKCVTSAK